MRPAALNVEEIWKKKWEEYLIFQANFEAKIFFIFVFCLLAKRSE